jgi:hypothetical protein
MDTSFEFITAKVVFIYKQRYVERDECHLQNDIKDGVILNGDGYKMFPKQGYSVIYSLL